jgi:hypothetical protein
LAKLIKRPWFIALSVCALLLLSFILFAWSIHSLMTTKLMELTNPGRSHRAELLRMDSIDRNYLVKVDGRVVYGSPDFAPRTDLAFRETLLWDRTGGVVILEVAGHRIFGYDAETNRRLSNGELLTVELPPEPPLWQYHFESEWPGIGRVQRPDASP